MFAEIVLVIIGAFYLINKDAKYRQNIKKVVDRGALVHTNMGLEEELLRRYVFESKREDFPEEYRDFFDHDGKAKWCYCRALASRDVWKQGYRPWYLNFMPKSEDYFLTNFATSHAQKLKEFHEARVQKEQTQ